VHSFAGLTEEKQMVSKRTLSAHARSTARTPRIVLISIVLWNLAAGHIFGDSPENPTSAKLAKAALLAVPLSFEANQGQTDSQVQFLSRGDGYSLFLTSNEVVFTLRTLAGVKAAPSVFRMELLGAERNAQVSGADKLPGVANYFIGNDPKKWRCGIGAYGKVKYRGIYPGVDAIFYGNQRQLEYDFVVAPGADPKQISLGFTGVTPSLDIEGKVLLKLADGDLALRKPIVYQIIDGGKKIVDARYAIAGDKVRFQLGNYDHSQTLVIDPVFTYLTYLGGSGPDQIGGSQVVNQTGSPAQALAIDSAGDVYVTGFTMSADFPVANPYQPTSKTNTWTAFVSALNPSGTALLYSTYLGVSVYTEGNSVVWDSHDNALYVVGTTNSPDFPITAGAFQTILAPNEVGVNEVSAGQYNAFVAKFSPSGQLTNSTFLGGNYPTTGFGIAMDPQGRAYVVGFTQYNCIPPDSASYSCFPTTPGAVIPAGTVSQNGNGFVSVFDPKLSTLLYSTLLGDPNGAESSTSEAFGVTVDPSGNFYVVGVTGSLSLPTTPGAFQPKIGTSNAIPLVGFAAKFGPVSASGVSLTYLTYLEATGLSFGDLPGGVVADSQGNAYIGGYTNSTTFPLTPGAYQGTCVGNNCVFVTKLNPKGTGLVWSTFVEVADYFGAIQLDAQGNVYVTGYNSEFFQGVNALQPGLVSGGFVSELDPTGANLLFSSLVGAAGVGVNGNSSLSGLAVDASGNIYVAGNMIGDTLPTTPGVVQPSYHGGSGAYGDGMIAKISPTGPVVTLAPAGQVEAFAAESIMSVYGVDLATGPAPALTLPLPTSLDGNSVTVTDSAGVTRTAPLYYVAPGQINFEIPAGTAAGTATVTIQNQNGTAQSTTITIGSVSPGIFPLNGSGLVAAWVLPVVSGAQQALQPVYQLASGNVIALPVGLGPSTEQVYLEIYGTGFRNAKSFTATVGDLSVPVLGAAATSQFVGEDQVNIGPLPQALAGMGNVNIVITADGHAANTVNVTIQ
jgi:uncharacterized protein (TIGR03437 family)